MDKWTQLVPSKLLNLHNLNIPLSSYYFEYGFFFKLIIGPDCYDRVSNIAENG